MSDKDEAYRLRGEEIDFQEGVIKELEQRITELTAENKQLNTDLRIALSVQGANGFKLSLKEGE